MATSITLNLPYGKNFVIGHVAYDGVSNTVALPCAKILSFRFSTSDTATVPTTVLSGNTAYLVAAAGSVGGTFIAKFI